MGENCSIIFVHFEQNLPKKTHFTQKTHENSMCVIIPMLVFYPKQPL